MPSGSSLFVKNKLFQKKLIFFCEFNNKFYLCICNHYKFIIKTMREQAIKTLQEYGIQPSLQRIAIMEYLLTHRTHPTVEEVYVALFNEIPTLSKTTVYNTLRLFSESGAALMLTIDEKKVCFDGDVSPHGHFMCRECGMLFDVELPQEIKGYTPELNGFRIDEMHVYYKGVCNKCCKKEDN
jgi:Fe2+ or Zn2+ uptake regulation protein